jgi:dolichol-phosphate mannosyltransferase
VSVDLEIVIPVYNEGDNILDVLRSLKENVKTTFQVLICYDRDDDTTLTVLKEKGSFGIPIVPVKNKIGNGPHGAVRSGFLASTAPAVIVMPADDDYNGTIIDPMMAQFRAGNEIVSASRFIPGGCMEGCPFLKHWLVTISSFLLKNVAFLPISDATNGFRLFSRKTITEIPIESQVGFTFSIELLVKVHRLRWNIAEVPARWMQRKKGVSRFKVLNWVGPYLYWFFYGFGTTYLRGKPPLLNTLPQSVSR